MGKLIAVLGLVALVGIVGVYFFVQKQPAPPPIVTPGDTMKPTDQTAQPTPTQKAVASKQYSKPPQMTVDTAKTYQAVLKTNKGTMKVGLFVKETPVAVNNFVFLAREGFYNSTVFHRIIS